MALRSWYVKLFGEEAAQQFEQAGMKGAGITDFLPCNHCQRPIPAEYVVEKEMCPVCRGPISDAIMSEARKMFVICDHCDCQRPIPTEYVVKKEMCPVCRGPISDAVMSEARNKLGM